MEVEWISLQEFMRRKKIGQAVALQLLHQGKYEYEKTEGGRYKIKIGGNTVPIETHEELKKKYYKLLSKLEAIEKILI